MNRARGPLRMLDREHPIFDELRSGLRAARRQGASAEQRMRLRAGLGLAPHAALEASASKPFPDVTPPAVLKPWMTRIGKLVLPVTLVTLAALGGQRWVVARSRPHPAHVVTAAPVAQRARAKEPSAARAESPSPDPATSAAPAHGDRLSAQAQRRDVRPAPHRSTQASAAAPTSAAPPRDAAGELALLGRARADARAAPERALALIAQHEQRYVQALFAEEREVIAVEALLNSGRVELARQRASQFFARFPASAHTRRLRAMLARDSDTKPARSPHPSE